MVFALFPLELLSMKFLGFFPSLPKQLMVFSMMLMPTIGYIDTARLMINQKSDDAFSMHVALVLFTSNALKITFWFFEPYPALIFGQAVFLFLSQLLLSYLHFKYLYYEEKESESSSTSQSIHLANFQRMKLPKIQRRQSIGLPSPSPFSRFQSLSNSFFSTFNFLHIQSTTTYLQFCISLISGYIVFLIIFLISWLIFGGERVISLLGLIANVIDAFQTFPLFIKIVIKGDNESTSWVLLVQQEFGDLFKIVIIQMSGSPFVFLLGSLLMLAMDSTNLFFYFCKIKSPTKFNDTSRLTNDKNELEDTDDSEISY